MGSGVSISLGKARRRRPSWLPRAAPWSPAPSTSLRRTCARTPSEGIGERSGEANATETRVRRVNDAGTAGSAKRARGRHQDLHAALRHADGGRRALPHLQDRQPRDPHHAGPGFLVLPLLTLVSLSPCPLTSTDSRPSTTYAGSEADPRALSSAARSEKTTVNRYAARRRTMGMRSWAPSSRSARPRRPHYVLS